MPRFLPRPSSQTLSVVFSATALAVAVLGATPLGAAVAAIVLPKGSVGTAQLRDGAVTPGKIKAHSLTRAQFASGALLVGPAGAPGTAGVKGDPGAKGDPGTLGAAGIDAPSFFGSGSSGSSATCGTIPDGNYVDVTIPAGCTAHVHRLFVRGTLTIGNNATLQNDGEPAGFSTCAPGTGGGWGGGLGYPALPGQDLGGAGQNTGTPGQWGTVPYDPSALVDLEAGTAAALGLFENGQPFVGGQGGGSSQSLIGCGAGGGGVMRIVAHHVVAGTGVTLSAQGGSSSFGSTGGAGGGGVIVVVSLDAIPSTLTMNVSGGRNTGMNAPGPAGNGYALWLGP